MADTNGLRKDFSQNTSKEGTFSGAGAFSRFGPTVEATPGTILIPKNKESSEKTPLHESITARGGVFGADTVAAKAPIRVIHRVGREVGGTPISPEELAKLKRSQTILEQAEAQGLILDIDTEGNLTMETGGSMEEVLEQESLEQVKKEKLLAEFKHLKRNGTALIGKGELDEQDRKKVSDLIDSIEELISTASTDKFPLDGLEKKILLLTTSVEILEETFETLLKTKRSHEQEKATILEESVDVGVSLGALSVNVKNLAQEELSKEYEELTLLFASLKRNPTPETLALIKTKLAAFQNNVDARLAAHTKSKKEEQAVVVQDTQAVAQPVMPALQPETSPQGEAPTQPLYTNRYEQGDVPEFAAIKFKTWPDEQMRKVVTQGAISWKHFNKAGALLEEIHGEDALFWEELRGNLGSVRVLCEKFLNTGDIETRRKNREFSSEIRGMYENLLIAIYTADKQEASQTLQTLTTKLEELKSEKKGVVETIEPASTFDDLKKLQKNEILTTRFNADVERHEEIVARHKSLFQYLDSDYIIGEFARMLINLNDIRKKLEGEDGLDEHLLSTYEKYLTDLDKEKTGFLAKASAAAIEKYGTRIIAQLTHSTLTPNQPEKLVPIRGKNARASLLNLEASQLKEREQYIKNLTPSSTQSIEENLIEGDNVAKKTTVELTKKQEENRATFIDELASLDNGQVILNEQVLAEINKEKERLQAGTVLRRNQVQRGGLRRTTTSLSTQEQYEPTVDVAVSEPEKEEERQEPVIMGSARIEPSMDVAPKKEEILAETTSLTIESAPQEMTPEKKQELMKKVATIVGTLTATLKQKNTIYAIVFLASLVAEITHGKEKGEKVTQPRTLEQAVSWRDDLTEKEREFSNDLVGRNALGFESFMRKYAHSVNLSGSRRGDLVTIKNEDLLHSPTLNFPTQERQELCDIIKLCQDLIKKSQVPSFAPQGETFMALWDRTRNAINEGDRYEGKQL